MKKQKFLSLSAEQMENTMFPSQQLPSERETDIKTPYMTIADHLSPSGYQEITDKGRKCDSLQEAYDVYVKKITEDYSNFKDTLLSLIHI